MMLSRITCAVVLRLGLVTSVPTVSLAETTPDAEQLEFDGLQRLLTSLCNAVAKLGSMLTNCLPST